MRELLIETLTHIPPARALEHLTLDAAERRLPGASHSIAEIVAHMEFWQRWFLRAVRRIGRGDGSERGARLAGGGLGIVDGSRSSAFSVVSSVRPRSAVTPPA